jgi:hypothetical protein
MDVYIYLDESGHLHKNSYGKFFALGAIILTCCNNQKVKRKWL